MPRVDRKGIAGFVLAMSAAVAAAAQDEVPRAPRLSTRLDVDLSTLTNRKASPLAIESLRPPSPTELARLPKPPSNETSEPDEIIVVGRGWKLPDLGSAWRAKQAEKTESGRFEATFLPFYDPSKPPSTPVDPLMQDPESRRHGYIELFRLRFGRRAAE